MERELKFETAVREDVVFLKLFGSLEVDLQAHLTRVLNSVAPKETDVVLDCSAINFIDSSCLGTLVSVVKTLRTQNGDIKLALLTDDVRSIFQITRLDKVFAIFDTLDEAVASYYR